MLRIEFVFFHGGEEFKDRIHALEFFVDTKNSQYVITKIAGSKVVIPFNAVRSVSVVA